MNEVLHANIFFIIASVATVIFFVLVSMILFHAYKITKSLRSIVERIESGSEVIAEDVAHVRELISTGGIFASIFRFITGSPQKRRSARRKTNKED